MSVAFDPDTQTASIVGNGTLLSPSDINALLRSHPEAEILKIHNARVTQGNEKFIRRKIRVVDYIDPDSSTDDCDITIVASVFEGIDSLIVSCNFPLETIALPHLLLLKGIVEITVFALKGIGEQETIFSYARCAKFPKTFPNPPRKQDMRCFFDGKKSFSKDRAPIAFSEYEFSTRKPYTYHFDSTKNCDDVAVFSAGVFPEFAKKSALDICFNYKAGAPPESDGKYIIFRLHYHRGVIIAQWVDASNMEDLGQIFFTEIREHRSGAYILRSGYTGNKYLGDGMSKMFEEIWKNMGVKPGAIWGMWNLNIIDFPFTWKKALNIPHDLPERGIRVDASPGDNYKGNWFDSIDDQKDIYCARDYELGKVIKVAPGSANKSEIVKAKAQYVADLFDKYLKIQWA